MLPLRHCRWLVVAGLFLAGPITHLHAQESRLAKLALREEIKYAPPAADEPPPPPVDEEAIEMAPVTVMESMLRRDLERTVKSDRARREEQKFSWRTGGRFKTVSLGGKQADLGLWPTLVEREGMALRGPDVMLNVDLFRLKW